MNIKQTKAKQNRKKHLDIGRKGGHSWQSARLHLSPFSDRYKDMTTIILPGSLIPPLTAKVEQSFSLMKPICTRLRNRVLTKNLSHCIRICKSWDLKADEYEQILRFIAITMTNSFLIFV